MSAAKWFHWCFEQKTALRLNSVIYAEDHKSDFKTAQDVPRGSILGPTFTNYLEKGRLYADDTDLFTSLE